MGELQWALLIVCVVLVVILYVLSRRGAEVVDDEEKYNPMTKLGEESGQSDLFKASSPDGFDEFGVGKKRKASGGATRDAKGLSNDRIREPPEPSVATLLHPLPGQTTEPRTKWLGKKKQEEAQTAEASSPEKTTAGPVENKMVALILAHTEENDIEGPALHAALAEQGLRFGEGKVYHRMVGGQAVYSVASLIKPGTLVPEEAEAFTTKGLAVVLNLPGPVKPVVALDDMMETTIAIAKSLKLGIFDSQRQPLTAATGASMRADVEEWAGKHGQD